jgi:6-phosphogluconolactonase (cycloisomerase 2 family)
MIRASLSGFAALALLAACNDSTGPADPAGSPDLRFGRSAPGAVYTSTNAAGSNEVLAFSRAPDGTLSAAVSYATGGTGAGAGLGSQGAVVLTDNGRWLLVVNAGSNDVSVFRVRAGGLERTDVEPSGGVFPVSIATDGELVYVLNAGGTNNVSGFRLHNDGDLVPIAASTRGLSGASVGPAQASFTPDRRALVVTEKGTNLITTFAVARNGLLSNRTSTPSETATPFGFAFDNRGHLIVSEAAGGAPGASAVSSYAVRRNGGLETITPSVATTQTAACWVLMTQNGRIAYTTNTGSGSVSAFEVSTGGSVALLHAVAANTGAGSTPIDMALSRNGRFVFVLAPGSGGTVRPYSIASDGTLVGLGPIAGVPATAYGLAAR